MVWRGGAVVPLHAAARHPRPAGRRRLPGEAAARRQSCAGARRSRDLQARADEVIAGRAPADQRLVLGRGHGAAHAVVPRTCTGCSGAVVGAVDLVRGIGRYAGMDVLDVPGATGDLRHRLRRQGARRRRGARTTTTSCGCTSRRPTRPATWATCARRCAPSSAWTRRCWRPILRRAARPAVLVLPDHYTPLAHAHARRRAGALRHRRAAAGRRRRRRLGLRRVAGGRRPACVVETAPA